MEGKIEYEGDERGIRRGEGVGAELELRPLYYSVFLILYFQPPASLRNLHVKIETVFHQVPSAITTMTVGMIVMKKAAVGHK